MPSSIRERSAHLQESTCRSDGKEANNVRGKGGRLVLRRVPNRPLFAPVKIKGAILPSFQDRPLVRLRSSGEGITVSELVELGKSLGGPISRPRGMRA